MGTGASPPCISRSLSLANKKAVARVVAAAGSEAAQLLSLGSCARRVLHLSSQHTQDGLDGGRAGHHLPDIRLRDTQMQLVKDLPAQEVGVQPLEPWPCRARWWTGFPRRGRTGASSCPGTQAGPGAISAPAIPFEVTEHWVPLGHRLPDRTCGRMHLPARVTPCSRGKSCGLTPRVLGTCDHHQADLSAAATLCPWGLGQLPLPGPPLV